MKHYSIKEGYAARPVALTLEGNAGDYWTPGRIKTAAVFQYDVYLRAAELLKGRPAGKRAVCDVGSGYPTKSAELLAPVADEVMVMDQHTLRERVAADFPGLQFRAVDLEAPDMPPPYGRFDVVVCADVIEHLLDPDRCLAFLKRITKSGGHIVISTPERDVIRGKDCMTSPKPEHVREWNMPELAAYLKSQRLTPAEHVLLPEQKLTSRLDQWRRYLPGKKTRKYHGCQMVVCYG